MRKVGKSHLALDAGPRGAFDCTPWLIDERGAFWRGQAACMVVDHRNSIVPWGISVHRALHLPYTMLRCHYGRAGRRLWLPQWLVG